MLVKILKNTGAMPASKTIVASRQFEICGEEQLSQSARLKSSHRGTADTEIGNDEVAMMNDA
jgi:hypothetical protein